MKRCNHSAFARQVAGLLQSDERALCAAQRALRDHTGHDDLRDDRDHDFHIGRSSRDYAAAYRNAGRVQKSD